MVGGEMFPSGRQLLGCLLVFFLFSAACGGCAVVAVNNYGGLARAKVAGWIAP